MCNRSCSCTPQHISTDSPSACCNLKAYFFLNLNKLGQSLFQSCLLWGTEVQILNVSNVSNLQPSPRCVITDTFTSRDKAKTLLKSQDLGKRQHQTTGPVTANNKIDYQMPHITPPPLSLLLPLTAIPLPNFENSEETPQTGKLP